MSSERKGLSAAAAFLRETGVRDLDAAVVLGSGLSSFAEGLEGRVAIPYEDVPGFPAPGVRGHAGAVVHGSLGERNVLVYSGRVHYYEGRSHSEVTWQIRLLAALDVPVVVVTNAAGGIDPGFDVGDIMLIVDQISGVTGPFRSRTDGTFRMAGAYTPALLDLARREAGRTGVRLREGVYMGSLGPSYETPAEVAAARKLGAQAVGMSTVAEVQAAHMLGMDVLGLSLITNVPLPGRSSGTTHAEVLAAGEAGAKTMLSLVAAVVGKL